MLPVDWFVHTLAEEYRVNVNPLHVGNEALLFNCEEMDKKTFSSLLLQTLPDAVIAETCQVEDQHGHEWLGIIFIDPETYQWLCQLILKNDDLLSYKKINSLKVFNDFLSSKQLVNQAFIKMKRDRIKVASGSESVVTVLSDAEVDHLLFDLEHNPNISQRNRLMVYFLLYTGVRVSELVSIKITDIDPLTAILTVRGKGSKIREINLRQDLLSHLHQYLRGERQQSKFQDSVYLFVSQRSPYLHRDAVRKSLVGWS